MHRPVVMGRNGMVASAHPLASQAGVDVLKKGGNAVDAAIATNAVLGVTQPHMCGVGGDLFLLAYWAGAREVVFLNASGKAPRKATCDEVCARGHDVIPFRHALAVTVPGCVEGWQSAWKRFGRYPWEHLFNSAIEYAGEGFPASHDLSAWIVRSRDVLEKNSSTRSIFLPTGRAIEPGELLAQPDLAETLRCIASVGREGFYSGEVAERISSFLADQGGLLSEEDLALYRSDWRQPVHTTYRGHTIYSTGDNSQGIAALLALNVLEGYDIATTGRGSASTVHHFVQAIKRAFVDRDLYVADPEFAEIPVSRLLSKEYAAHCRAEIERRSSAPVLGADPRGDTTGFVVADGEGNVVSVIQSLYFPFGSGLVAEGTGVLLQNRGASFSLDPTHVNCLEPGKRPFHTLMASIVTREGRPVLGFATMGAEGQPQTTAQVISNVVDHGMNVQDAIEEPRWLQGRMVPGEPESYLQLEGRFPPEVISALGVLGHEVRVFTDWAHQMGHAQGIVIQPENGVLMGGADPRGDGYAIGW